MGKHELWGRILLIAGDIINLLPPDKKNLVMDMLDLFDQTDPFEERAVASLDFCEDFVCQSDDYYTYNDYFYQLSRKMADK